MHVLMYQHKYTYTHSRGRRPRPPRCRGCRSSPSGRSSGWPVREQVQAQVPMVAVRQKMVDVLRVGIADEIIEVSIQGRVQVPMITKVQKEVQVLQIEYEDHHTRVLAQKRRHVPIVVSPSPRRVTLKRGSKKGYS